MNQNPKTAKPQNKQASPLTAGMSGIPCASGISTHHTDHSKYWGEPQQPPTK
jgi:hypothetical protein